MLSYAGHNVVAMVEKKFVYFADAEKLAKAKLQQARDSGDDVEEERCELEYDTARKHKREAHEELLRLYGTIVAR